MTALATRVPLLASLPRLAVRTRSSENQITMFSVISIGAVAFMMLLPSPRAAFAAVEAESPAIVAAIPAQKAPRLDAGNEADRACEGQAWGSETLECILAIARDSGMSRSVRLADASVRQ
jgi:hypothetical protein